MEETIFKKTNYRISGSKLFKALIQIRPLECECCHLKEWQGKPIKLEVHHKDGDYTNNCLDNLSLLCPNCHSYTDSWCQNKRKEKISDEQLINTLKESVSIHQALVKVGLSTAGTNYLRAKSLILKYHISLREPQTKTSKYITNKCSVCGKEIGSNSIYCSECVKLTQRTIKRPNREELKKLIRNTSFVSIGKQYGVSDNAVKKWCDFEKLPRTKKEIKTYSDAEWELI